MSRDDRREHLAAQIAQIRLDPALTTYVVRGASLSSATVTRITLERDLTATVVADVLAHAERISEKEFLPYDPSYQLASNQVIADDVAEVPAIAELLAVVDRDDVATDAGGDPVIAMVHRVEGAGEASVTVLRLTGAGIATLNPIPEVPAGDIDLIAPLGTIDAGEAGIRVSGNINIAALRVVNAANIQTQGKSSGVPVTAAVNTGAMSSASAAGAAASQAAEDAARSQQAAAKQGRPSIVTVEVLSFGSEPVERSPQEGQKTSGYNPNSPVQVLGAGPLGEQARARLTDEERKQISL